MASAHDVYGAVFKNGTATLMARVVGDDAQPIVPDDIDTAEYSVYLLDDRDPDSRTAVAGHENVTLNPGDILFGDLQIDDLWEVDDVGYNFRHTLDVSAHAAFPTAYERYQYLVEFRLTPVSGQVILVRFRVKPI